MKRIILVSDYTESVISKSIAELLAIDSEFLVSRVRFNAITSLDLGSLSVVILLPDFNGSNNIVMIDEIKQIHNEVNIIVLISQYINTKEIKLFFRAGVNAILHFQSPVEQLFKLLGNGVVVKNYLCSAIVERILTEVLNNNESNTQKGVLTEMENSILTCAKNGFSIKETAVHLNLSANTVAAYRSKIISKMNVRSITNLICESIQ